MGGRVRHRRDYRDRGGRIQRPSPLAFHGDLPDAAGSTVSGLHQGIEGASYRRGRSLSGKILVVGAGVAGLTLAERMLARESAESLVLVERGDRVGGLARSFQVEGYTFDIGPHRFHTAYPEVESYVRKVLAGGYLTIPRASSVYLLGRYHDWPLTLSSVLRLPPRILLPSVLDLLRRNRITSRTSFADHIRARYGENLYQFFFRDYTRKFTGTDAEQLHLDWAEAGVNRAVIDRKVNADSLAAILRGLFSPKQATTQFIYPESGGIQAFADGLARRIRSMGGKIKLNCEARGVTTSGERVTGIELTNGERIPADRVYWSAPLTVLFPDRGLSFIHTVLYFLGLGKRRSNPYQWCYFGEKDVIFSRTTVPRNFFPGAVPEGRDSIAAEITCPVGSDVWKNPERFEQRVMEDLARVGAIDPDRVEFVTTRRIRETYPVYDLRYVEHLRSIQSPEGLVLLGRCGTFWYNNMDHSIAQALALSRGESFERDFWR
ncbi:FAD-dependent oxidoreductase [Candidatus Fermentibacteria bacterium]|nr:FAD-dependent oxidoreductase [Candidatus Fermentibacteria bacterium]